MVIEQGEPFIENILYQLRSEISQGPLILGKISQHVPIVDEIRYDALHRIFSQIFPRLDPKEEIRNLDPPLNISSKVFLCDDCPYLPVLTQLKQISHDLKVPQLLVVGDTGCVVRADNPPLGIIDVKYSMGSSIGIGVGLAKGLQNTINQNRRTIVSLCGDSAFLHSGLLHLINATTVPDLDLLIFILDNKTTALTGFQSHPLSPYTIYGGARAPLNIKQLVEVLNLKSVVSINPFNQKEVDHTIRNILQETGIRVVIVDHACPLDDNTLIRTD